MEVEPLPVPLLVDLVNGWGRVPRDRGGARARADLDELVRRHAVPDGLAATFGDAVLEAVADEVHPVFATPDPAARATLVNELLGRTGVRPALVSRGGRVRPTWLVAREEDAVLAAVAVTLHAQLAEHDPGRLGTCAARGCADVFVDASPGAHRRFCSITCQNRERVAAFRRRRSAGAHPSR